MRIYPYCLKYVHLDKKEEISRYSLDSYPVYIHSLSTLKHKGLWWDIKKVEPELKDNYLEIKAYLRETVHRR